MVGRWFWHIALLQPWTFWSSSRSFDHFARPKMPSPRHHRPIFLALCCFTALAVVFMDSKVNLWVIRPSSESLLLSSASEDVPRQELLTSHHHNNDKFRQLIRDAEMLNDMQEAESKRLGSQSSHSRSWYYIICTIPITHSFPCQSFLFILSNWDRDLFCLMNRWIREGCHWERSACWKSWYSKWSIQ